MQSPFKFLDPYTQQDREIFFGREKETDALYELVNQNRLVLVYGPSGAGKTSLIQCGLSNRFHPTNWYPLFVRRGDNLNASLRQALTQAKGEALQGSLVEEIEELYEETLRPVYLIFDQLEEIFVLGTEAERIQFIQDIAALNEAKIPCQVIFSLREEYLAHLYPFEQVIPTLFDRRLRVEPMGIQKAVDVIQSSCATFNIQLEAPEANAKQIIDKISAGRSGVSLPYLQVCLDRLYREDLVRTYGNNLPNEAHPTLEFTTEEIDELGEIGDILTVFLDEQVDRIQGELAQRHPGSPPRAVRNLLNGFASLEGTKIPRNRDELSLPGLNKEGMDEVLEELGYSRILREQENVFELAHDTLSLLISDQRSAEEIALLKAAELIRGRLRDFEQTETYLNSRELQQIENHTDQLKAEDKLNPAAWDFVNESRAVIKAEERRRKLTIAGVIAVLTLFLALAGWQWWLATQRTQQMKVAQRGIVKREMEKKDAAIYDLKYEEAYQIVKDAMSLQTASKWPRTLGGNIGAPILF